MEERRVAVKSYEAVKQWREGGGVAVKSYEAAKQWREGRVAANDADIHQECELLPNSACACNRWTLEIDALSCPCPRIEEQQMLTSNIKVHETAAFNLEVRETGPSELKKVDMLTEPKSC
eukprot:1150799-Pelagomonas_calceolata.AAC.7